MQQNGTTTCRIRLSNEPNYFKNGLSVVVVGGAVAGVVVVGVAGAVGGVVVLNKKGTNHELSSREFFSNGSFCCGCSDRHAAAISYRDRRGYWRLFFVLML